MIVERLTPLSSNSYDIMAMREHVRVDELHELDRMALAAVLEFETYSQIALINQAIRVTLDAWPRGNTFFLPVTPLADVLSVDVTSDSGSFDSFAVEMGKRPAVRLTGPRPTGLIVIEYEAGFGDSAHDVPADIRMAIMDQVAAWYDLRGDWKGNSNGMSPHFARVAARYRRVSL